MSQLTRYTHLEGRRIFGAGAISFKEARYEYYFSIAFGRRVYTFDMGQTWATSKRRAFVLAGYTL